MMSNMKTMFDLNRVDSQGGMMEEVNTLSDQKAINAIEVRNLNFFYRNWITFYT